MRSSLFSILLSMLPLIDAPSYAFFWNDNSYEECMLTQMKGQAQSMYSVAQKLCSKRFKREYESFVDNVSFQDAGSFIGLSYNGDGDFEAVRGTFRFSIKTCGESQDKDFSEDHNITFKNNTALISKLDKDFWKKNTIKPALCMKGKTMYRYK